MQMYRGHFALFGKFRMDHFAFRVRKQRRATLLAILQKKAIFQQHRMSYTAFPQGRFDLRHGIAVFVFIANQCPDDARTAPRRDP